MSDMRDLLERKAARFPRTDGAFESVAKRVHRRQRGRRVVAGSIALIVAAVGAFGAYRLTRSTTEPAAGGRTPIPALWPEQTLEDAQAAQARADDGEDTWRLQAQEVATRFARETLGWPVAYPVDPDTIGVVPAGPLSIEIEDCGPGADCVEINRLLVTIDRLVTDGPTGIWSVVKVDSGALMLQLEPGEEVLVPTTVTVPTNYPNGTTNLMFQYDWRPGECAGGGGLYRDVAVDDGELSFELAPEDINCSADDPNSSSRDDHRALSSRASGFVAVFRSEHCPCGMIGLDPNTAPGDRILDAAIVPVTFVPVAVSSPTPDVTPSPQFSPVEFWTVWPEHVPEEAEAVQAAVDDGDPDLAWRTDPEQVVRRFARDVMGRTVSEGVYFMPEDGTPTRSAAFNDEFGTLHSLALAQPAAQGDGGIWSVTQDSGDTGLQVSYVSVGFEHDQIQGQTEPGATIDVSIAYGGEGDEPTFDFSVTADEHGEFLGDLRTHYGDWLPIPTEFGRVFVGVRSSGIEGYTQFVAIAMPPAAYCYPCS